jgi:hypothetical protein
VLGIPQGGTIFEEKQSQRRIEDGKSFSPFYKKGLYGLSCL